MNPPKDTASVKKSRSLTRSSETAASLTAAVTVAVVDSPAAMVFSEKSLVVVTPASRGVMVWVADAVSEMASWPSAGTREPWTVLSTA